MDSPGLFTQVIMLSVNKYFYFCLSSYFSLPSALRMMSVSWVQVGRTDSLSHSSGGGEASAFGRLGGHELQLCVESLLSRSGGSFTYLVLRELTSWMDIGFCQISFVSINMTL